MINRELTAKKLFNKRKENGYTVKELARKLHVTEQAIYQWEEGYKQPSFDNLMLLAYIYNCSIYDLFEQERIENV